MVTGFAFSKHFEALRIPGSLLESFWAMLLLKRLLCVPWELEPLVVTPNPLRVGSFPTALQGTWYQVVCYSLQRPCPQQGYGGIL